MTVDPDAGSAPDMAGAIIKAWRTLYPAPERGWRGDPGGRAALRRADTAQAVLIEPAFHELLALVRESGVPLRPATDAWFYRRVAVAIGALAERRGCDSGSRTFAAALGGSIKPEERRLKTLRFQALIAALDRGVDSEALSALRRAVKILGDEPVDVHRLVRDLLFWGEKTRIAWTFAYFGQTPPQAAPIPYIEEQAQ